MDSIDSLTILKYKLGKDYKFHVMDKFDEPDEPTRLDKMIEWSNGMAKDFSQSYEQIWIKTCPIFPTKG